MGQGSESCGGYEVEYDPYEEGLATGIWTMRNGVQISVNKMTQQHLANTIKIVEQAARNATFSDMREMWEDWKELLESKLKDSPVKPKLAVVQKQPVRGSKITLKCHCGAVYQARSADYKRGWGLSCSKRCAAIRRDFGRNAATVVKQ